MKIQKIQTWWEGRTQIERVLILLTVVALLLLFSIDAKAETNSCIVCVEKTVANHAKQQTELQQQCQNYADLKPDILEKTLYSIVDSIADDTVQKVRFDCDLYNQQLKKSFIYRAELQRK